MIPGPVLQMCGGDADFIARIGEFAFVDALACVYAEPASLPVVALLVYTAVGGSIYIRSGSLILPFGLLLLTGGAVVSQIASVGLPVVVLLVIVVPAGVTAYLYYRVSR